MACSVIIRQVTVTKFQCQLAFAARLWVKPLEMFFTVISLKYASLAIKLVIVQTFS